MAVATSGPGMVPLTGVWGQDREMGEQEQRVAAKALPHLEPPANLGCHISQLVRARSMRLPC